MNLFILIGPFPPPVHGASTITEKVATALADEGIPFLCCDTAPATTTRGTRWHLSRLAKYGSALLKIVTTRNLDGVYLSVSGGLGLLYDVLVVSTARIRGVSLVLHHHSFAYLNRNSYLMAVLTAIGRANQTHIVLCPRMGRIMTEKYGSTICCTVVSNIAFLELGQAAPRTRGLQRVGFLSNLLPTKGIDRFLDLAREIASDGLKAEIAGPFPDEETRKYVMERIAMMPHVTYHGALYGRAKTEFLRHIDLFVFPSRYMNEAEPLVLYEAMAEGLPISATSRGCVPDMLNCTGSVLLDQNAEDLEVLVSRIRYWHNNPSAFAAAAVSAHAGFKALFADRDNQYQRLIRVFTDRTQC